MSDFEAVVPALSLALTKRGYAKLTPVQEAVLAPGLLAADMLVSAQTGSGKTVAFGMAIAPTLLAGSSRFERVRTPLALAVAPTRELALQVKRELEWLYGETGAMVASCVGGMDMRDERRVLSRGPHIVVGTPGRLRDHIERGAFDTSGLKAVVLDEADEMLDLGFREDLEYILEATPADRRTLLFSATVPRSIAGLAKRYQRDAVRVSTAAEKSQHVDIEYRALTVAPNDRENSIINVLRYFEPKNALVFCSTRASVNHMTSRFTNRGISVVALSGELSQSARSHALQALRDGRAQVCIATDVAARGIDLPNLELVIHADIPRNAELLLHRSGRTGRAGRKGICTLIVPHNWRRRVERLLVNARIEATWARPPSIDDINQRDRERIFEDPLLMEALKEDELSFAQELIEKHGAAKIAGAFVRQHLAGRAAPEDLLDIAMTENQPRRAREDFKGGAWISLSVGREHNAEPRWLLPTICRAGHLTKRDIGAIKIHQNETYIELTAEAKERFLAAVGPSRRIEKNITVSVLDGPPKASEAGRKPGQVRKKFEPRDRALDPPARKPKAKPQKKRAKTQVEQKPHKKKNKTNKNAGKPKSGKTKATRSSSSKPGSSPLKRREPSRGSD